MSRLILDEGLLLTEDNHQLRKLKQTNLQTVAGWTLKAELKLNAFILGDEEDDFPVLCLSKFHLRRQPRVDDRRDDCELDTDCATTATATCNYNIQIKVKAKGSQISYYFGGKEESGSTEHIVLRPGEVIVFSVPEMGRAHFQLPITFFGQGISLVISRERTPSLVNICKSRDRNDGTTILKGAKILESLLVGDDGSPSLLAPLDAQSQLNRIIFAM